jgi:hypothetical protein
VAIGRLADPYIVELQAYAYRHAGAQQRPH